MAFDGVKSGLAKGERIIIDTAGRLHNKVNLMNELTKIKNVMAKIIPEAPLDVMLILDASTGLNAIEQELREVQKRTYTNYDDEIKINEDLENINPSSSQDSNNFSISDHESRIISLEDQVRNLNGKIDI